jgi:predicted nucleic acid-binding protein
VQNAIIKNETDIKDAILYELANNQKLDYFINNDKQALKKLASKKLPIVSTKEFLRILKV